VTGGLEFAEVDDHVDDQDQDQDQDQDHDYDHDYDHVEEKPQSADPSCRADRDDGISAQDAGMR